MYDDLQGEVEIFDFDEFANHLLEQGLEASPAELHGCLTGLLAGGAKPAAEVGLDALTQVLDVVLHGELAGQAMQLYTVTAAALLDEEFDFHPLLPEDSTDIAERVAALAFWCRGFLAGFAHVAAATDQTPAALPKDSSEIFKDFAAIAQAAVDDDDEDEEQSEGNYMELVEYIRFAALNVFMDCHARTDEKAVPPDRGRPVH
jgi:uncharacterized protein YgfB (UPF0149 family)